MSRPSVRLVSPGKFCLRASLIFGLLVAVVGLPLQSDAAQLSLSWTDMSSNEDGFKIERDAGPTGTFVQIATVGPNVTSYVDSGLASATTYCYRVLAFNVTGDSAYSNQACGTTPQTFGLAVVRAGMGSGTVTSTPAGITCGTSCSGNYASGTVVTLTATAATGSTFTGWSGGGCTGTGSCTVTLTATTTVTATFGVAPTFSALTVTRAGTGSGTVTSSPAGISCGATCSATFSTGSAVTFTATPSDGSTFTGWSGGGCSGTGSCTVTLSTTTTVTATFTSGTSSSSTLSTQNVIWTNPVNVTATGNSIQKTSGCDGCEDAGAISLQQILSGDGYLEFTASETTTLGFVGLSVGDTGTGSVEIRFAIRLQSGIAEVRESGISRTTTTFVTGDVFRISVQSGVVKYYKNGVLFYTSGLAPAYPLLVDSTLVSLDASISNAVISGVLSTLIVVNDTTAPVISAMRAVNSGASSATITWTTNEASDSQVEYGPTTAYGSSMARNASLVTSHSQALSGLAPSTLYHYRVKSRDAAGNLATSGDGTFTTAAPPPPRKKQTSWFGAIANFFKHLF